MARHPERSRPKGGAVEGPVLVDASAKQVPPLRLAALGSGRDDGWPYAGSHKKLDAAQCSIAIDEIDALEPDLDRIVDHGQVMRRPRRIERLLVGAAFDIVQRRPGDVALLAVVALVDLRQLQHVMAAALRTLAVGRPALQ